MRLFDKFIHYLRLRVETDTRDVRAKEAPNILSQPLSS